MEHHITLTSSLRKDLKSHSAERHNINPLFPYFTDKI
jgi:hypothetical protein